MKTIGIMLIGLLAAGSPTRGLGQLATASEVHVEAQLRDGVLFGSLSFQLDGLAPGHAFPALGNTVAVRDAVLPDGMRLLPSEGEGACRIGARRSFWGGRRSGPVRIDFSTTETNGVALAIPFAPARTFALRYNPAEYEPDIPDAVNLERQQPGADGTDATLSGNFPVARVVQINWKPAATRLGDSDSVRACRVETIALVSPGVIRHVSTYFFTLTQGTVREYAFRVPKTVNIVSTETDFGLLSQTLDPSDDPDAVTLTLTSRTESRGAEIRLVYEETLPAFPCRTTIEPIAPLDVLRTDGLLFVAPKGSVRIVPGERRNLLQTDVGTLPPAEKMQSRHGVKPASGTAYRYTTTPSALTVELEDVVTAIHAENTVVLDVEDARAAVEATLQLDLRDAPAEKIGVTVDHAAGWTVTAISGKDVAEGDVEQREIQPGTLEIVAPFERSMLGVVRLSVRMERKIDTATPGTVVVPRITVDGAVVQNGFVVAAAAEGIQLIPETSENLSEIHAASTPVRRAGAQIAWRFRGDEWSASIGYTRAKTAIHSELFHLVSPGDGLLHASAVASFHVSGAPADTFTFHVPERLRQVDVTCAEMDGWSREGDTLTVRMGRRIMGDWTMLIACEELLDYHGGECRVGEITTEGTESEMGFIVVAGPASLQVEEAAALPDGMIRIEREEIPAGYAATLLTPVTAAWKYMRAPHATTIRLTPLQTEDSLAQVVDFLSIDSRITRGGASVTRARYSVKNASGQYLKLRLPAASRLWRVSRLNDAGDVEAEIPSQLDGEVLLVPIERPRDPNQAATIEVQYATDNAQTPARHDLVAPVCMTAPVTFVEWRVEAGDHLGIRRAEGNLTRDERRTQVRFARTSVLPEDEPLELRVWVAPDWLARARPFDVGLLGAAALILGILFWVTRNRLALAGALCALGVLAVRVDACLMILLYALVALLLGIGTLRLVVRGLIRITARSRRSKGLNADAPPLVDAKETSSEQTDGSIRAGLLLGLCLAAGVAAAGMTMVGHRGELSGQTRGVSVWRGDMRIEVLPPTRENPERMTVNVTYALDCTFDQAGAYALPWTGGGASRSFVILDTQLPEEVVLRYGQPDEQEEEVRRVVFDPAQVRDGSVFVVVKTPGRHQMRMTLGWTGDASGLSVRAFHAVRAAVAIQMASSDWEVSAEPLHGRVAHPEADGGRVLSGQLGERDEALRIRVTPRRRDVESETRVMSANVDTYASVRSGVVDLLTTINYRVLQGVVRQVRIRIPESLHVVDLEGDVSEWRFDSETRLLAVAVNAPTEDQLMLAVRCNAVAGDFPYTAPLAVPEALDVTRQNGRIGIAASDAVLLSITNSAGCNAMRKEDFVPQPARWRQAPEFEGEKIRRAFRYDNAEGVSVTVTADAVKPDVRSTLELALSVGDERNTVSAQLQLAVAKAGVFSVNLGIPEGLVIETITGEAITTWDDRRRSGAGVDLFFGSRFLGTTSIYLVLSQQQQGVPDRLDVPRITVTGGTRQTGRATLTAERGIKLALGAHEGVVPARGENRLDASTRNALVLDILRADWRAALTTQVLDPVIKPELLHSIAIAEGMLQHRVYWRCRIENAGVKQFRIGVPVSDASLTVSGRAIARVVREGEPRADGSQIWLIELQGKVDDTYDATCFYQEPYDASAPVVVNPLKVVGAQRQTGWVVISGDSRIKVDADFASAELRAEDPRTIPDTLGAGDLSGALGCWKVLDPDSELTLQVTRHSAAEVLPAAVQRVRQTTVLSLGGRTLTQTAVSLDVGRLRFLRIELPDEAADLWSAQVNGVAVQVSRETDGVLGIPLDSVTEGDAAEVVFVWADHPAGGLPGEARIESVRFPDLPLRDIEWRLYAPSGFTYALQNEDFDEEGRSGLRVSSQRSKFDRGYYQRLNQAERQGALKKARSSFDQVGQMLEVGDRSRAQRVLRQAIELSQADVGLNEDARVQFENVAVENVKMGFMNRRDALRASKNIFDETAPQAAAGFNAGNFSREFARQLEGRLSRRDRQALELVSAKIVGQQSAASDAAQAISVTMPENGPSSLFTRALQTDPGGAMTLELSVSRSLSRTLHLDRLGPFIALIFFTPLVWLLLLYAFGRRRG